MFTTPRCLFPMAGEQSAGLSKSCISSRLANTFRGGTRVPLLARIVGDQVPGDFNAGKDHTVFSLTNSDVQVAPLICFEDTIGELDQTICASQRDESRRESAGRHNKRRMVFAFRRFASAFGERAFFAAWKRAARWFGQPTPGSPVL